MIDRLFSFLPLEGSPTQAWFDALSRFWSPYDVNPLNINPLKDVIERFVDFDAVREFAGPPCSFPPPTCIPAGCACSPRDKITADVVMASACLPLLFRAVEIDGVPYWDGGYMGNPAIFPFFRATETEDVLIVQINPVERHMTPRSQSEIVNRINEITFNSSLLGGIARDRFRHPADRPGPAAARHRTRANTAASTCTASRSTACSTSSPPPRSSIPTIDFFEMLRDGGRGAAQAFLQEHFDDIGKRSTVDLAAESRAEMI